MPIECCPRSRLQEPTDWNLAEDLSSQIFRGDVKENSGASAGVVDTYLEPRQDTWMNRVIERTDGIEGEVGQGHLISTGAEDIPLGNEAEAGPVMGCHLLHRLGTGQAGEFAFLGPSH